MQPRGRPFQKGEDPRRNRSGSPPTPNSTVRQLLKEDRERNLEVLRELRDSTATEPELRAEIAFRLLDHDAGKPGQATPPPPEAVTEPDPGEVAKLFELPALPAKETG